MEPVDGITLRYMIPWNYSAISDLVIITCNNNPNLKLQCVLLFCYIYFVTQPVDGITIYYVVSVLLFLSIASLNHRTNTNCALCRRNCFTVVCYLETLSLMLQKMS